MADTGAPAFIPLLDDNSPFTPAQAPFNAISQAVNTSLANDFKNKYKRIDTLANLLLPANVGTDVWQHATVYADPTAANNGDYRWSGTAWIAAMPGANRIIPGSVAGATVAGSTVNFTGASAVNVNGVFSSAYDNYHIEVVATCANATQLVTMLLRAGGADSNAANYDYTLEYSLGTAAATTLLGRSSFQLGASNAMTNFKASLDISSPFLNQLTTITADSTGYAAGASPLLGQLAGGHRLASSFDGFSIGFAVPASGAIRVYGWSN